MSRIITPPARISFPHLFEPYAMNDGDDAKYSASFVFEDGTDLSDLKKAAIVAAKEKWGDKLKGAKIKKFDTQYGKFPFLVAGELRIRLPWRDDAEDIEKKGYPEGSTFVNARTDRQPGVVGIYPGPDGRPAKVQDQSEVYPGANVKASLDPYAYDTSGNRGVTFGLGNVQVLGGGEAFVASATPAADEFEADPDAAADLSDLDVDEDEPVGVGAVDDGDDLSDLIG